MQVISNIQWSSNFDPLFRKNKILKLEDFVKLKTSKLILNLTDVNYRILSLSISKNHFRVNSFPSNPFIRQ